MAAPDYHGWTHRPKSEGGTDPIPVVAAGDLKWATAVMFQTATAKSGSWYYPSFTDVGTNDTGIFTIESAVWGNALGINEGGIYVLFCGQTVLPGSSPDVWGTNEASIEPIFEESGAATTLESESDYVTDFMSSLFGRNSMILVSEQPASTPRIPGLNAVLTINYDPPSPSTGNYGFEVPLKLSTRVLANQTGSVTFSAQITAVRIAATPGYTAVSA
jgi:hypothetical protein